MANSVITLTTAPTGTGKTYVRCGRFLWDEWLKENDGVHYSNFPIRFEPWEDEWGRSGRGLVAEAVDRLGMAEEEVRHRIQVIPAEETALWERDSGEFGPWSTFANVDLDGAHIAIDESHLYWPAKGANKRCKALLEWIADVRHRGCTVEFITQNRMQVSADLRRAVNREIRLSRWDEKHEPLLGIRLGDYLEVLAAFTGQYRGIVLDAVAGRVGVSLDRHGNLFYLGEVRPDARGVLVRRVRRLGSEDLQKAVACQLSADGRAVAYRDGLCVVCDRVSVLEKVGSLLDGIEQADSPLWCVQLYVVSVAVDDLQEFGLDVAPAVDVSLAFAAASQGFGVGELSGASLRGGIDAVLQAVDEARDSEVLAEPLFLLVDGEEARFRRGSRLPYRQDMVSQEGTVSSRTYAFVDSGLTIRVNLRERGPGLAWLSVDVISNEIEGYVDEQVPRLGDESFATKVLLRSGGVYLLGSLERCKTETGRETFLRVGAKDSVERRVLQVWGTAYAVNGDCRVMEDCGPVVAPAG